MCRVKDNYKIRTKTFNLETRNLKALLISAETLLCVAHKVVMAGRQTKEDIPPRGTHPPHYPRRIAIADRLVLNRGARGHRLAGARGHKRTEGKVRRCLRAACAPAGGIYCIWMASKVFIRNRNMYLSRTF